MRAPNDVDVNPARAPLVRVADETRSTKRRVLGPAIIVAIALLQVIVPVQLLLSGQPVPLPMAVGSANFVIVVIVLSLADRVLPSRTGMKSRIFAGAVLGVLAGGVSAVVFWSGAQSAITRNLATEMVPTFSMTTAFFLGAALSVLAVGAWSLAIVVPRVLDREELRALEVENLELETAKLRTQTELARLRGQLEPHFLLNTLNMIAGLVGMDVEKARRTLVCLGDLLRDTLEEHGEVQTIGEEIAWLQRYCEILEVRHGPSLRLTWDVDDSVLDALIPRLLLQPVVENAIVHGALRASGTGTVRVRVAREATMVVCSVEDNGPGPASATRPGAVGLDTVRRRLEIGQPGGSFELKASEMGTRAVLELPYVTARPEEIP